MLRVSRKPPVGVREGGRVVAGEVGLWGGCDVSGWSCSACPYRVVLWALVPKTCGVQPPGARAGVHGRQEALVVEGAKKETKKWKSSATDLLATIGERLE